MNNCCMNFIAHKIGAYCHSLLQTGCFYKQCELLQRLYTGMYYAEAEADKLKMFLKLKKL